jgi:hypothetical protein
MKKSGRKINNTFIKKHLFVDGQIVLQKFENVQKLLNVINLRSSPTKRVMAFREKFSICIKIIIDNKPIEKYYFSLTYVVTSHTNKNVTTKLGNFKHFLGYQKNFKK